MADANTGVAGVGRGILRPTFCVVATAWLCASGASRGDLDLDVAQVTPAASQTQPLQATQRPVDPELVALGAREYIRCAPCHGLDVVAAGTAPDLRASTAALAAVPFASIVRGGFLQNRGMPAFPDLTNRELEGLRYYIRSRADKPSVRAILGCCR